MEKYDDIDNSVIKLFLKKVVSRLRLVDIDSYGYDQWIEVFGKKRYCNGCPHKCFRE